MRILRSVENVRRLALTTTSESGRDEESGAAPAKPQEERTTPREFPFISILFPSRPVLDLSRRCWHGAKTPRRCPTEIRRAQLSPMQRERSLFSMSNRNSPACDSLPCSGNARFPRRPTEVHPRATLFHAAGTLAFLDVQPKFTRVPLSSMQRERSLFSMSNRNSPACNSLPCSGNARFSRCPTEIRPRATLFHAAGTLAFLDVQPKFARVQPSSMQRERTHSAPPEFSESPPYFLGKAPKERASSQHRLTHKNPLAHNIPLIYIMYIYRNSPDRERRILPQSVSAFWTARSGWFAPGFACCHLAGGVR